MLTDEVVPNPQPPTLPLQPSSTNKILWLFISLTVLFLATTGAFAYQNYQLKLQLNKVEPETVNPEVVKGTTCEDLDGLDYYTKSESKFCDFETFEEPGATSPIGCALHEDFCPTDFDDPTGKELYEHYCDGSEFKSIKYECPNGCQDGACINLCSKEDNCCVKNDDCEYIWFTGGCNTPEYVAKGQKEAQEKGISIGEAPPRENVTCTCEKSKCITHN